MTTTTDLRADAVIFDKDGTLYQFGATWDAWAGALLRDLSGGVPGRIEVLAEAVGFDLIRQSFQPDSRIIAGTNREAAECLVAVLDDWSLEKMERHLMLTAARAPLVEAVPLLAFLEGLSAMGLRLGVVTNDTEYGARAHLAELAARFHFIAGFDSGFGAKPEPGSLLAFARAQGIAPARVVMVGDSAHDLMAGRAAGMQCLGVLTGPAQRADLEPLADAVLPDIGHLPDWLRNA